MEFPTATASILILFWQHKNNLQFTSIIEKSMSEYIGEQWKEIKFDFVYTNQTRFEISNCGRVRSFNKTSNGNILKGSMIHGYLKTGLKFHKPRDTKVQAQLSTLEEQVSLLSKKLSQMKKDGENEIKIKDTSKLLDTIKQNLKKKFADDSKSRTIHWHALNHRLVAEYFVDRPSEKHTVVAHIDYEKLNNRHTNLVWMTTAENFNHQKMSPYVIKDKLSRTGHIRDTSKATKLTVTRVMLLKKMLNERKPMKELVRFFKVTGTQILRIKRGENWKDVEAAS